MSPGERLNSLRTEETREMPKDATAELRGILAELDTSYGAEKVNALLSNMLRDSKAGSLSVEITPDVNNPVSLYVAKAITRLHEEFTDSGDILNAIVTLQNERGIEGPN